MDWKQFCRWAELNTDDIYSTITEYTTEIPRVIVKFINKEEHIFDITDEDRTYGNKTTDVGNNAASTK